MDNPTVSTLTEEQAKFIAELKQKQEKSFAEIGQLFKEKYNTTSMQIDIEYGKYLISEASKVLKIELDDVTW